MVSKNHAPVETFEQIQRVHPAWMEVDLAAIASNYREVQRRVGGSVKIIVSLKADAYGHGAVDLARWFHELGAYAVATGSFRDAVAIRHAGIPIRIQMFAGPLPEGIEALLRHDLIPTVHSMETARAVSAAATAPVPVYVKIDAGLGRLGVPLAEAVAFVRDVSSLPRVVVEGVYTHLPFVDAAGCEWAGERLLAFDALIAALADAGIDVPVTQALASSGVAAGLTSACNTICTGHLLYGGLARTSADVADLSAFRPALAAVKSRLIQITRHTEATRIGTGGKRSLAAGSVTGIIPLGLFDGYRNPPPGQAPMALVRGRRVAVLGVTLEYLIVDLTGLPQVEVGDEVALLGASGEASIQLEEVAGWLGCTPLELMMSFDGRLPTICLRKANTRVGHAA